MIKFPVMGVKMSKSWTQVTLSLTTSPDRASDGYQYYAFNRNGSIQNQMYLWAFKWSFTANNSSVSAYSNSSYLKSWATGTYTSWQSPAVSQTISAFKAAAEKNWTNYHQIWWFQRMYVNCLYMMKYGNPNCQLAWTTVGRWFVDWNSNAKGPGTLLSNSTAWNNATWWESTGKVQARLFWLEDWRGNVYEWVDWAYSDAWKYLFVNINNTGIENGSNITTTAQSPIAWQTQWINSNYVYSWTNTAPNNYYANAIGNNWGGFFSWTSTSGSASTYYCDFANLYASRFAYAGGYWNGTDFAGAFYLYVNYDATNTYADIGARLAYI